jgi:hypothetical protein
MSDTHQETSPFDVDLSSVETDYQILSPGSYVFRIGEILQEPTKKGGMQLVIKLQLESTGVLDIKGKDVAVGHQITHRIGLSLTEKYTKDMRDRSLKAVMQAFKPHETGAFGQPDSYLGTTAIAKIDVEDSEQYGSQNRVKKFSAIQ